MPLPLSLALLLSTKSPDSSAIVTLDARARSRFATSIPTGRMNEIMPGQIMVKMRPSMAQKLVAHQQGTLSERMDISVPDEASIVPNGFLQSRIGNTGWTLWRVPASTDVKALAAQLKGQPGVLTAEPVNRIYPLLAQPNDPDWTAYEDSEDLVFSLEGDIEPFRRLWHLEDTHAFESWSIWPNKYYTSATKPADPPLIAVIDTGCDMNHPDFINAGGSSSDSAFGGQLDKARSARFELGEKVPGSTEDLVGHGTHVTGIALAAGNNGAFSPSVNNGTLGTGYACRGMVLRVFDDQGVGTDADAAAAIYEAIDQGADVINLSLGTTNFSQLFQDAVTAAFQSGCLVVASGNEDGSGGGNLGPIYPAACSGALAVTANGEGLVPATSTYAGYGSYVDIAAPGGDVFLDQNPFNPSYKIQFVWSTSSRDPNVALAQVPELVPPYTVNYSYLAGTSMASPAVAGAAGMYYGKNGLDQKTGWANLRTYRALERSAIGVMGAPRGSWELYQGYGSLDMQNLLLDANARNASVGAIEGIVYYNSTALANVTVRAQRTGDRVKYQTSTRPDGSYRFEMLPAGVYNVTAIPFGAAKVKSATVVPGCDQTAVDFWCGTYSGDETSPVVGRFDILSFTNTSFSIRHWAYDPETSIDRMSFRIGTTPGGTDVMADTEVFPESNTVSKSGLTIPPFNTFQARYVNGGNMTTTVTRGVVPLAEDVYVRDGAYATQNFSSERLLLVKNSGIGLNRVSYLKLDTSAIPGDVSKVTLKVLAQRAGASNCVVDVLPTSNSWSESSLTWNTAPAATGGALTSFTVNNPSYTWYELDLTNYVRQQRAAGHPVMSVIFRSPASSDGANIKSKEAAIVAPEVAPETIVVAVG